MKYNYILFFTIFIGCISEKQAHRGLKNEDVYFKIKSLVPSSWEVMKLDSTIVLRSKDSVWFVPSISPVRSTNESETLLQVFIELQPKWSDEKIIETRKLNDSLSNILIRDYERTIDSLNIRKIDRTELRKYPIEHIKKFTKWNANQQKMVNSICRIPDITTSDYSVFISDNRLFYDDEIYPETVAIEEQKIISKIAKEIFNQDNFKLARPRY